MEVALLGSQSVKIKSKSATFGVSPVGIKKQTFDGVLFFDKPTKTKDLSVEGEALIIQGPGDYELKTVKLTGLGKSKVIAYQGKIDGIDVCITRSSFISLSKELFDEYQVIVLEVDGELDPAIFAKLNATVAILYGARSGEYAKSLGKEPSIANKFSIAKDKLPTELQVVLLQ